MSKHLRNYPDVNGVFDSYGSDAMRWFLMSSPILRGGNLIVTSEGIRDVVRQVMLPLWSSYYFFTLYANAACSGEGYNAKHISAESLENLSRMDRYILARTRQLVEQVQKSLDEFAISRACAHVADFIDTLTNWYIRNTRDRFWKQDTTAFDTLYTALEVLSRTIAPLAPMEAETIWRGLTGGESVHVANWPYLADSQTGEPTGLARILPDDKELVSAMEKVRQTVSAALSLRKAEQIRVRQPLSDLTVVLDNKSVVEPYADLLKSELNVKNVKFITPAEADENGLRVVNELKVNARAAGPRIGKNVQFAIKASRTGDWHTDENGNPVCAGPDGDIVLQEGEYELINRIEQKTEQRAAESDSIVSASLPSSGFVLLNTALNDELIAEGVSRDVIRLVQDARKEAGLNIDDRIKLTISACASDVEKLERFRQLVSDDTQAAELTVLADLEEDQTPSVQIEKV